VLGLYYVGFINGEKLFGFATAILLHSPMLLKVLGRIQMKKDKCANAILPQEVLLSFSTHGSVIKK
jgi:hypothetical protein